MAALFIERKVLKNDQYMKGIMSYLVALLSIMGLFTNCCRKKDPPIYKIPQEIKDWFWADTGSYWAYEVNRGIWMDTCRVTEVKYLLFGDEMGLEEQVKDRA